MNEEVEDDEIEEEQDSYLQIEEGQLVIFDENEFREATGAVALHVTMEGGVYVLLKEGLVWKSFPLSDGKPKLKTVR